MAFEFYHRKEPKFDYRTFVEEEPLDCRCSIDMGPFGKLSFRKERFVIENIGKIPFVYLLSMAIQNQEVCLRNQRSILNYVSTPDIDNDWAEWKEMISHELDQTKDQLKDIDGLEDEEHSGFGNLDYWPEWHSKMLQILRISVGFMEKKLSVLKELYKSKEVTDELITSKLIPLSAAQRNQQKTLKAQLEIMAFQARLGVFQVDADMIKEIEELLAKFERLEATPPLDRRFTIDVLNELDYLSDEVAEWDESDSE